MPRRSSSDDLAVDAVEQHRLRVLRSAANGNGMTQKDDAAPQRKILIGNLVTLLGMSPEDAEIQAARCHESREEMLRIDALLDEAEGIKPTRMHA